MCDRQEYMICLYKHHSVKPIGEGETQTERSLVPPLTVKQTPPDLLSPSSSPDLFTVLTILEALCIATTFDGN